jgi:hypothetical protein
MERRTFLASLLPLAACACGDKFDCGAVPDSTEDRRRQMLECEAPTPQPTPIPEPPKANTIEFRVLGDVTYDGAVSGTVIQWGSTQEGTTLLTSTLPWFASTKTFRDNLFLVLSVNVTGIGTLQAQIIINNELFREATATGFNPKISLSGLFSK